MTMNTNFKCPCCGEKTLTAERMFDICKICGWEDDNIQFSNPDYFGGANYFSLNKYREVFLRERNIERVKEIQETERDKAEAVLKAEYAERIRIILQKRIDFGSAEYWTQKSKKELIDFVSANSYEFRRFRNETASSEENILLDESAINFENCKTKSKRKRNDGLFDEN